MNRDSVASQKTARQVISKTVCRTLLAILASSLSLQAQISAPQIALSEPLVLKWRYQSDQISNLTPAADRTTIFLPLAGGGLLALNAADGKLLWRAEGGGESSASPIIDDRSVYAATSYSEPEPGHVHGTLRALSKVTGV